MGLAGLGKYGIGDEMVLGLSPWAIQLHVSLVLDPILTLPIPPSIHPPITLSIYPSILPDEMGLAGLGEYGIGDEMILGLSPWAI